MDTIKSKTVSVVLGDGSSVEVRRMKWKAAREFLKKLAAVAVRALPKDGNAADFVSAMPGALNYSDELLAHIITASSSITPAQLDDMDAIDAMRVLNAAFEINYDDELKNFLAGIVGKLVPQQSAPEVAPAQVTTS